MSEQHFRCVTEPELSRFHSLSFKRLQLLTKFSATGNCLVPSSFSLPPSLPASRSAVCLRLASLVMLRILCRLFPVSEGFVIAVNWTQFPVRGVCVYGVAANAISPVQRNVLLMISFRLFRPAQVPQLDATSCCCVRWDVRNIRRRGQGREGARGKTQKICVQMCNTKLDSQTS